MENITVDKLVKTISTDFLIQYDMFLHMPLYMIVCMYLILNSEWDFLLFIIFLMYYHYYKTEVL